MATHSGNRRNRFAWQRGRHLTRPPTFLIPSPQPPHTSKRGSPAIASPDQHPTRDPTPLRSTATFLVVAVAYVIVGELSEQLATQAADIAAFWPPAGIGVAAVVIFGPRIIAALAVGAFIGNFFDIGSDSIFSWVPINAALLLTAAIDAGLAAFEAALAWAFLYAARALPDPFKRVRTAAIFIVGPAAIAATLTALTGTALLVVTGNAPSDEFGQIWLTWTAGDAVGILVIAPLLIAWRPPIIEGITLKQLGEMLAILAVLLLIAIPAVYDISVEYLAILPLTWASFRLGLRGATLAVLVISIAATLTDIEGHGYFARYEPHISLLFVQTFVGSIAVLPLALVPALNERRDSIAERVRVQQDLLIAQSIQQGLLPDEAPDVPRFDIAGWSMPADETGGDYYDWIIAGDGRLIITLADVTGHGIGPALVTAACRAYIRAHVNEHIRLNDLLDRVNKLLVDDLPLDRFVTLAAVCIDPPTGRLWLSSAGQGPICIYRKAQHDVQVQAPDGVPLGIVEDYEYNEPIRLDLEEGDALVLITDGFIEWADEDGELFGTDRFSRSLAAATDKPAGEIITALANDVRKHAGNAKQTDDLTAIVIKRQPGRPA